MDGVEQLETRLPDHEDDAKPVEGSKEEASGTGVEGDLAYGLEGGVANRVEGLDHCIWFIGVVEGGAEEPSAESCNDGQQLATHDSLTLAVEGAGGEAAKSGGQRFGYGFPVEYGDELLWFGADEVERGGGEVAGWYADEVEWKNAEEGEYARDARTYLEFDVESVIESDDIPGASAGVSLEGCYCARQRSSWADVCGAHNACARVYGAACVVAGFAILHYPEAQSSSVDWLDTARAECQRCVEHR